MKATEAIPTGPATDVTDQDFEEKVLERSKQVPVLVDFWAPWCGPCKVLGPTLEKLAEEFTGRFELVKVNMDENPLLAQVFQIRSIPAVKLFMGGEVRDEFMGAYPEPEIRRFLEHHLPGEVANDADQGFQLLQAGDAEGARKLFEESLAADAKDPVGLIGMGYYHLQQGDVEEANRYAEGINEVQLERLGQRQEFERLLAGLKARIYLAQNMDMDGDADDADDALSDTFRQACRTALEGDFQAALEAFLSLVRTNRAFRDDAGRKAMLAVFSLLPPDSPLVQTYRSKLSNLLFS